MTRHITPWTTLDNLRNEAKRWLKALRAGVADARARLARALPDVPAQPTLRDVQHALAREYGQPGWSNLKGQLEQDAPMRRYERVADALVTAYRTGEADAMRIVWDYFGHMRAWAAMRRYVRLDLGKTESPQSGEVDEITLDEARFLVARAQGFESWPALTRFASSLPSGKTAIAAKSVALFRVDVEGERHEVMRSRDWDEVLTAMRERKLPGLHPASQMTDALLERFTRIEHITSLDLSGSKGVTDEGLQYLARLPQLHHLDISGCAVTDRGLAVLRELPALETVVLSWLPISDAGVNNLANCQRLKMIDLGGTPTGDGALQALAGKNDLSDLRTGNGVTDAGLALLHEFPVFKRWRGGVEQLALTSPHARPNFMALRGPFSNEGLAQLVGLDGLFALDLDNDRLAITGAGLAPLQQLPHLAMLGFDAKDDSMPYIAALPHLRFLMCQDTTAGDDGFVALSRSQSIEYIWGRRCYNLQRRGFAALADLPALRYLSVSCKNVDDVGVSALPRFPALRELMPMDMPDEGYRHVGACTELDSLVLMYCRDTGDRATEHIAGLPKLRKYFVSYNRITDRTPQILSGMESLEEITIDTCAGVSSVGIAALARLPNLRQLSVSGMPMVTRDVVSAFPETVRVRYEV